MGSKNGVLLATILLGAFLFYSRLGLSSGNESYYVPVATATQFDHTHAQWDAVLKKFVTVQGFTSQINYRVLKKNRSDLDVYVDGLETVTQGEFDGLSENERLAFLINAYNALTVKLIIDNYPVKSIKDIGGVFSSPWKKKFFKLFGEDHSLDDIEQEMIRKKFNEPRIHFALVCASKGCPALRGEAYLPERLNDQLDDAANNFLKDSTHNYFDVAKLELHLSSIFKWYGSDFLKKFRSLNEFVAPRMARNEVEKAKIKDPKTKILYLDYDWSLNETPE